MQRKVFFSLLAGGTLVLGGCGSLSGVGGGSQSLASLAPLSISHPLFSQGLSQSDLPLLARYYWVNTVNNNPTRDEASYGGLAYKPRQSTYAGFEGWDVFQVNTGTDETRSDFLRLQLNRPARVTVVWQDSALWLAGWQKGSLSASGKTYNTYTKDFSAGEIALGSPSAGSGGTSSPRYFVLLAEQGGVASKPPRLPAGIAESSRPPTNDTCPDWLEGVWQAKGPDGNFYKTWHPQIDPIYWCYYRYENGSDPSLVGYTPTFNYVAKQFGSQPELIVGFKGFAIRDKGANQGWYINIHSETGVQTRACARFHTVVIAVTDLKTGELKAELAYKGDFGATISNQSPNTPVSITCPDPRNGQQVTQSDIAKQTDGAKNLRVSGNGQDPGGYENWHGGGNPNLGMSYWGDNQKSIAGVRVLNVDIRNPATFCSASDCNASSGLKATGSVADQRTLFISNLRIQYTNAIDAVSKAQGEKPGYFWTDLYGNPLAAGVKPGDPGSIRQFIKPGFDSGVNGQGLQGGFSTEDAWRQVYLPNVGVPGIDLENSLLGQN